MEIIITVKKFYSTEEQFNAIYSRLKIYFCPHCNLTGFLILHGVLYGFSEHNTLKIKRGRRVLCSNRNRKKGCGRTFSILNSGFIKKCVISAESLWKFLNSIKDGNSLAEAFRQSGCGLKPTSVYNLFKKFQLNQVRIRTVLLAAKDPPPLPDNTNPTIQTICHLAAVFSQNLCPISQFQYEFQKSFY